MSKYLLIFGLLLSLCLLAYILFLNQQPITTVEILIGGKKFYLEKATTVLQQTKGLMHRKQLGDHEGMIFVYDFSLPLSFWMKNTYIPLDMIFLDSQGKIITIHQAQPEAKDENGNYLVYSSTSPAKFVIEINSGLSDKIGIKVGDTVDLSPINN